MTAANIDSAKAKTNALKRFAVAFIFLWFIIGGIGHFWLPDFFLKIIPPTLPFRIEAVYISGFFELLGAVGLLRPKYRQSAGIGLFLLTIAVTPANVYMWRNPQLFPAIPEILLALRLVLQAILLVLIVWATRDDRD